MTDRIQELLAYWEADQQTDDLAGVAADSMRALALRDTIAALELLSRAKAIHLSSGGIGRNKKVFTAADCAAFAAVIAALEAQHHAQRAGETVPIPVNADQAELMAKLGINWLRDNAPERLRKAPDLTTLKHWTPTCQYNDDGYPEAAMMESTRSHGRYVLYADVLALLCELCTAERKCPDHGAVVSDGYV